MRPKDISKEHFIEVCKRNLTMAKACKELELHFNTFKKYALKYGCYETNQAGKGISKNINPKIWSIDNWNNDKPINVTRAVIRKWILRLKLIVYKCNLCGINEWNGKPISLELNHINGNNSDHRKSNLEFLCPNCHAQTETYRGKNK